MTWQDGVLALGSVSFGVALVPTIRGASKPALATSVVTAAWLAVFAGVYASLSLWFACVTSAITASLWAWLGWQVLRGRAPRSTTAGPPGTGKAAPPRRRRR